MPDYQMCEGGECPQRMECARFRAVPGVTQSYYSAPPYVYDEGCEFFFPTEQAAFKLHSKSQMKRIEVMRAPIDGLLKELETTPLKNTRNT